MREKHAGNIGNGKLDRIDSTSTQKPFGCLTQVRGKKTETSPKQKTGPIPLPSQACPSRDQHLLSPRCVQHMISKPPFLIFTFSLLPLNISPKQPRNPIHLTLPIFNLYLISPSLSSTSSNHAPPSPSTTFISALASTESHFTCQHIFISLISTIHDTHANRR